MSKIMKALRIMGSLVTRPQRILKVYDEDEVNRRYLQQKYGLDQLPTIDLLELVPDFETDITRFSFLDGTSTLPDIALLKSLAKQCKDCVYLEIGSWRGESIANVAEVARQCYSITLSEEEMRARNFPEDVIRLHGFFSRDLTNIRTFPTDSATFDYTAIREPFDLIFVDGDHSYSGVKVDSANVIQHLRSDDSIIVWHDYGYSAETCRHTVLAGILDGLPREYHQHLYHVSNTMCAVLCRREFKSKRLWKCPETPNKTFTVSLKAQAI